MREQIVPGTKRACTEVHACVILLIDGMGHFTYSWSPTRSLRVGNGLATPLDNMRQSIHAPHCNPWCLQVTQSKHILVVESAYLKVSQARANLHIGSFTWFSRHNSRMQQFHSHIIFNLYPTLNTWYCLWSDSWLMKGVWVLTDRPDRQTHRHTRQLQ